MIENAEEKWHWTRMFRLYTDLDVTVIGFKSTTKVVIHEFYHKKITTWQSTTLTRNRSLLNQNFVSVNASFYKQIQVKLQIIVAE